MKLINADAFFNEFSELGDYEEYVLQEYGVKAIPIEWIEKWMLDNWELECNYGIEQMIEDWEKENADTD